MTNHITSDVLHQLQPLNGRISSVTELSSESSTTQSRLAAALRKRETDAAAQKASQDGDHATTSGANSTDDGLPALHASPEAVIRFTPIPRRKYPEGATPAQVTKYSMDHSYVLQSILNANYRGKPLDFLGEIQLSFVCFLLGQVFDAFEQWKQLVNLLCCSDDAMADQNNKSLYLQFLSVLHFHLKEIPHDFFVDIVTQNNFLVATLGTFFSNLSSGDASADLKKRGELFRENLEKRFHWNFGDANDDEQPVVVVCSDDVTGPI